MWPNIWTIQENSMRKDVYSASFEWNVVNMSVRSSCFIVLFNSSISLLIFDLVVLPIIESVEVSN